MIGMILRGTFLDGKLVVACLFLVDLCMYFSFMSNYDPYDVLKGALQPNNQSNLYE